ncbi:SDR family NAD(P)-dependent oxidoreductase, partial [uncultured Akkermansia sp.]|uniref:SDR family NAD(P)-dependent oxidoreductase n=1 Tax=uncultured Akkermansia sp. TaxID=512294 RepID=UPI00260FFCDB
MRRVFISGGHGGLARAVVECFSAAGWETDAPGHAVLDVGDRSAVRRWFDCHAAYDLAVCAAGITRDRPFLKQTEEEWDEVMNVNVTGAAWCGRCAAAAMMREKRQGQVGMVGSSKNNKSGSPTSAKA